MQVSRVSLQAFMALSATKTVCCSGCAELLVLAMCFKVDLDVFFLTLWGFFSFSGASLQPLFALCT